MKKNDYFNKIMTSKNISVSRTTTNTNNNSKNTSRSKGKININNSTSKLINHISSHIKLKESNYVDLNVSNEKTKPFTSAASRNNTNRNSPRITSVCNSLKLKSKQVFNSKDSKEKSRNEIKKFNINNVTNSNNTFSENNIKFERTSNINNLKLQVNAIYSKKISKEKNIPKNKNLLNIFSIKATNQASKHILKQIDPQTSLKPIYKPNVEIKVQSNESLNNSVNFINEIPEIRDINGNENNDVNDNIYEQLTKKLERVPRNTIIEGNIYNNYNIIEKRQYCQSTEQNYEIINQLKIDTPEEMHLITVRFLNANKNMALKFELLGELKKSKQQDISEDNSIDYKAKNFYNNNKYENNYNVLSEYYDSDVYEIDKENGL